MSVFVYHVTVLWNNIPVVLRNCIPNSKGDASNFTPQVKEARNQSQIFNRKSISLNTTYRQSYQLQAMLTGVKRRTANTSPEKVNNLKIGMKKLRRPNRDK